MNTVLQYDVRGAHGVIETRALDIVGHPKDAQLAVIRQLQACRPPRLRLTGKDGAVVVDEDVEEIRIVGDQTLKFTFFPHTADVAWDSIDHAIETSWTVPGSRRGAIELA